jgi:DNA-binding transcriptional MerR regulator
MSKDQPSKLYYSISEVASITKVKAHVLRYWEGEFPTLRPRKTRSGSRRYRQKDIEEILAIKALLYEEGFKIAGAKKMRWQAHRGSEQGQAAQQNQMAIPFAGMSEADRVKFIKDNLQEILQLLGELKPGRKVGKSRKLKAKEAEA